MRSKAAYRSAVAVKAHRALAEFAARHDLAFQPLIERDALAHRKFAARPHQRLPIAAVPRYAAQQKNLHRAAQVLVHLGIVLAHRQRVDAGAMAEQPGREDARIVDHQAIAGASGIPAGREMPRSSQRPSRRCTTSMRAAARSASASCAMRSSGRWKSKSASCIQPSL